MIASEEMRFDSAALERFAAQNQVITRALPAKVRSGFARDNAAKQKDQAVS